MHIELVQCVWSSGCTSFRLLIYFSSSLTQIRNKLLEHVAALLLAHYCSVCILCFCHLTNSVCASPVEEEEEENFT